MNHRQLQKPPSAVGTTAGVGRHAPSYPSCLPACLPSSAYLHHVLPVQHEVRIALKPPHVTRIRHQEAEVGLQKLVAVVCLRARRTAGAGAWHMRPSAASVAAPLRHRALQVHWAGVKGVQGIQRDRSGRAVGSRGAGVCTGRGVAPMPYALLSGRLHNPAGPPWAGELALHGSQTSPALPNAIQAGCCPCP